MRTRLRTALAAAVAVATLAPLAAGATAARPAPVGPAPPTHARAWVGRVLATVAARTAPRTTARVKRIVRPIAPFAHGPTDLLITRTTTDPSGKRWVEVLLPVRPNGTRGWIPLDVLRVRSTTMRISIDLGDRRLSLFRAGRRVMRIPVVVGKPSTPTPRGRWFAVAEVIRTNTPGAFLGPIVMPLTGFSQTLNEYAGGDGRVAIHGTSVPSLIGTAASHGCVRLRNADVRRLARLVRPGTPVAITR
jgi:lipoprotein-anchoring transpeptidase ErfK/SrfK